MAFTFAGQYTEAILATGSSGATLLPSLTTHVYTVGTTTHVTLYTSRTKGTTTGNPVTTDVNGNLTFFVDPGQYDLVFTPPGGSLKRITVTVPQDPAEDSATYVAVAEAPINPLASAYGAVGDGITDDSAAIFAALTAAKNAGGGEVILTRNHAINTPQGAAPVDSLGNHRSLLYLAGFDNVRLTALKGRGKLTQTAAAAATLIEARDCTGFEVEKVTLVGTNLTNIGTDNNANVSGSAVRFTNVTRGKARQIDASLFGYSAVYFTAGTSYSELFDSDLHELGAAGNVANGFNEDNLGATVGAAAVAPIMNVARKNRVLNVRGAGAYVLDNGGLPSFTTLEDNMADNPNGVFAAASFQAYRLVDVVAVELRGNKARNFLREGIFVSSTGPNLGSLAITGGIVDTCGTGGFDGVLLDNAGNGEIRGFAVGQGMVVRGCGNSGIRTAMSGANSVRAGSVVGAVLVSNDQHAPGTGDAVQVAGRRILVGNHNISAATGTAHRYGVNILAGSSFIELLPSQMESTLTGDYNDGSGAALFRTDINTSQFLTSNGAFVLKTVAGAVTDAAFPSAPLDGALGIDRTNNKIYVRIGGAWKSVAVA